MRRGGLVLLVLWVAVLVGVWLLSRQTPSLQRTLQFVQEHPFDTTLSAPKRQSWITEIAAQLNELESEDRQRVLIDPSMRRSIVKMTEHEKAQYLQLALAKGIPEVIEGFTQARPERRQRWIDQALNELEQLQNDNRGEAHLFPDQSAAEIIAQEGLAQYWREADVTTRVEMQPFLERIQSILQVPR